MARLPSTRWTQPPLMSRAAAAWVVAVFAFDYLFSQIKVRSPPPRTCALSSHTASHRINTTPPAFLHALLSATAACACAILTRVSGCCACSCALCLASCSRSRRGGTQEPIACASFWQGLHRAHSEMRAACAVWRTKIKDFGHLGAQNPNFFWPRRGDGHRAG